MALLLRPLYERWLLDATQGPLPAWKRGALMQALQKDTALRCLAAELAEFSHETHGYAADKAPDMRTRVVALATEPHVQRPLFPSSWVPAGGIALLLLLALVAVFQQAPVQQAVTQQANHSDQDAAKALSLPTATATSTPLPLSPTPTTGAATPLSPAAVDKRVQTPVPSPTAVFSR